jgi:nitroreductase
MVFAANAVALGFPALSFRAGGDTMDLREVMRTTFAAREFTDDTVDDATLHRILDAARFAPSGGNRQGWHVIVVRDAEKRRAIVELIKPTMRRYLAQAAAGENPWNTVVASKVDDAQVAATEVPDWLVTNVLQAPLLLLVAVDLRVVASFDAQLPRVGVISGASIYPFVWNILLAARNEGLGGTLTTFLAPAEAAARALFDLPDGFAVTALLPIGKPVKQLTKLKRKLVEDFTTVDSYAGPRFGRP